MHRAKSRTQRRGKRTRSGDLKFIECQKQKIETKLSWIESSYHNMYTVQYMSVCSLADCCIVFLEWVMMYICLIIIAIFKLPLRTASICIITTQSNVFAFGIWKKSFNKLHFALRISENHTFCYHVFLILPCECYIWTDKCIHLCQQMTEMNKPARPAGP